MDKKASKNSKPKQAKTFQPSNSALKKLLLKQNMEVLRVYSQKEFSEVFLGFFLIFSYF